MYILVFLIRISLSAKTTEYKLGFNFGETIYDYSGKGRHGTNSKFKFTDRGVYLDGSLNSIPMKSPAVPSTSSIIFWILPKSSSGAMVCYGNENDYLTQIRSDSSELRLDWSIKNFIMTDSGVTSVGAGSFTTGSWKLVLSTRKATNCNFLGVCSVFQYNYRTSSYTATDDLPNPPAALTPYFFQIGAKGSFSSIQGFLWYFVITDTLETYSSYLTSTNPESCILNSCLSCSEKIIDPTYGNICLSTSTLDTKNKENSDCPSLFGCSYALTYSCGCSTKSCGYNQNTNKYFCVDTSTGASTSNTNPTCLSPFVPKSNSCCLGVCSACSSPMSCSSCIDPNAMVVPNNCQCKAGFFGSPSTTSTSTCSMCGSGCSSCLSSSSCQGCYDLNAQVSGGVCVCKDGFVGTPAAGLGGQGCSVACVPGCGSCSGSSCISCADKNAQVNGANQCVCKSGYSGTPSSSLTVSGCSYLCSVECSSCDSSSNCLACFDPNAEMSGSTCICKAGMMGTPSLSASTAGCHFECSSLCKDCLNNKCSVCIDALAVVNNLGECICGSEAVGEPSNSLNVPGCQPCPKTRVKETNSCSGCKDLNAELNSNSECICKTGYVGTPSSDSNVPGCVLSCNDACIGCINLVCDTCNDINAEVINGLCVCKQGFSGKPSEINGNSGCVVGCPDKCNCGGSTCDSCKDSKADVSSLCVRCIDANAEVLNGLCVCKQGYHGTPSENVASSGCLLDCNDRCTCIDSNCVSCKDPQTDIVSLCTSCIDIHAELVNGMCVCIKGYKGTPSEISGSSGCVIDCSNNCNCIGSTCTSCKDPKANISSNCASCIDSKAEVINGACVCKQGYDGIPSDNSEISGCSSNCPDECSCLESKCLLCNNPKFDIKSNCTNCIDIFAEPINGDCQCKPGFFISSSNGEQSKNCQPCGLGCKKCDSFEKCDECFDLTADIIGARCFCQKLMYMGYGNICQNCSMICGNCSDLVGCTKCLESNSQPFNGTCVCNKGMYVIGELSKDNKCKSCHFDCETCEKKDICLTCNSTNSKPSKVIGCECEDGFWKETTGNIKNYCVPCKRQCKTCENNSTCTECKGNSTYLNYGHCYCNQGFYYPKNDSIDCIPCKIGNDGKCNFTCEYRQAFYYGKCFNCPENCSACDRQLKCTKCLNKEEPVNGVCECNKGKKMDNGKCKRKTFEMEFHISRYNEIFLNFDEALEVGLLSDMISLNSSTKNLEFRLKKLTKTSYKLTLADKITSRSRLNFTLIILYRPLYSVDAAEIKKYVYSSDLNQKNVSQLNQRVSTASQIAAGAAFATSVVSNPATCWIVLNTIQLITYLPLASINYSEDSLDFFQAIGSYNTMPDFIEPLISRTSSEPPGERMERVGIESSVFWANFGKSAIVLLVYIGIIPLLLLGTAFRLTRMRSLNALKNYGFSVFIRFFIQTYLDICLFSLVQMISTVTEDIGYFSFGSACLLIVFFIQVISALAPVGTFFIVINANPQDEVFTIKYGSLFNEFKNDGKKIASMFYVCFFVRRFQYALSQVLLYDFPKYQMGLNLSFGIFQFGFLVYFRPFKDKLALVSEVLGEICALIAFFGSFVLTLVENQEVCFYFEKVIQWTVISGIGVQVIICFGVLVRSGKEFYQSCRNRKQKIVLFPTGISSVLPVHEKEAEIVNTHSSKVN